MHTHTCKYVLQVSTVLPARLLQTTHTDHTESENSPRATHLRITLRATTLTTSVSLNLWYLIHKTRTRDRMLMEDFQFRKMLNVLMWIVTLSFSFTLVALMCSLFIHNNNNVQRVSSDEMQ